MISHSWGSAMPTNTTSCSLQSRPLVSRYDPLNIRCTKIPTSWRVAIFQSTVRIWNVTIRNREIFKIWTFLRWDFKCPVSKASGFNQSYGTNHLKTWPFKVWTFFSRFQMFFDKIAARFQMVGLPMPDFKPHQKSEPFVNQPLFDHSKLDPHCALNPWCTIYRGMLHWITATINLHPICETSFKLIRLFYKEGLT